MSTRREALILLAAGLLPWFRATAQQARKVYRIGVLSVTSRSSASALVRPFEQGLRELGYFEGQNMHFEWRSAEGRLERLPAFAAELVARKVDVIVAGATAAAVAAKNATSTIPIVFVAASDPVALGLVKSLARPGTNVTGFTSFGDATAGKQLELMRDMFPRLRRLAVIHSPGDIASKQQLSAVLEASAVLKLQVRLHGADSEEEFDKAFRAIAQERPEGLKVLLTAVTFLHRKKIVEFVAKRRLAAVYGLADFVEAGGLLSYSFSYADNYRRTVAYVNRILKGTKPADLPVQQPMTLELAVNLKTAKAARIKIPPSVMLRADRVIE